MDCYQTLRQTRDGRLEPPPCECDAGRCDCGAWIVIQDRHGNVVGRKPLIAASTRKGAALDILDRCGLTVPKRVEFTGADGKDIMVQARMQLAGLSDAQFEALAAAFVADEAEGGDGGDDG
jgi:hypothetical protein